MARLLTAPIDEAGDVESRRRGLMFASDQLLDEVEVLRLADETDVPASLQDAIDALQRRLSRNRPTVAPVTLHAAHDLVFAVQQRLMAANPKHPRPNRHQGRPTGQPLMTRVHPERLWKLLTLPAPPNGAADADWLELVESTVERAWDRWCYAQQHAVRAARARTRPQIALAVARIAWTNYWELQQEATAIRYRLGARTSLIRAGGLAALRR
jgi:LmbE family N-acetylglucosaminyl deacetylase